MSLTESEIAADILISPDYLNPRNSAIQLNDQALERGYSSGMMIVLSAVPAESRVKLVEMITHRVTEADSVCGIDNAAPSIAREVASKLYLPYLQAHSKPGETNIRRISYPEDVIKKCVLIVDAIGEDTTTPLGTVIDLREQIRNAEVFGLVGFELPQTEARFQGAKVRSNTLTTLKTILERPSFETKFPGYKEKVEKWHETQKSLNGTGKVLVKV
jgi:hypothetical protein